jgi:hypothetical protein
MVTNAREHCAHIPAAGAKYAEARPLRLSPGCRSPPQTFAQISTCVLASLKVKHVWFLRGIREGDSVIQRPEAVPS